MPRERGKDASWMRWVSYRGRAPASRRLVWRGVECRSGGRLPRWRVLGLSTRLGIHDSHCELGIVKE